MRSPTRAPFLLYPCKVVMMRGRRSFENEDTKEWLKHEYKEFLERYWKSVKTLKSSKEREAAA
jgi:hypothetical protein